jgi:glucose uptake protein GlcU
MFFQWIMCSAIWMVGLIVQISRGSPRFEPFAMLGGALWCTGNMASVPVIQLIGLGLGMLLWGGSNLVFGWAVGYFGLLGVKAEGGDIKIPALNIVGVLVCAGSLGIMNFVKTVEQERQIAHEGSKSPDSLLYDSSVNNPANVGLIENGIHSDELVNENNPSVAEKNWADSLSPASRKLIGVSGALLAGAFYAVNFNPPQYLKAQGGEHSQNLLDYVFSHFTGIFTASTVYFLIYCVYKRNSPFCPGYLVLPSYVSGLVWACAQTAWFVANDNLPMVVSFPLITACPGIVATVASIILFKEIQGRRNFAILAGAISVTITGVIFITLSKVVG